MHAVQDRLPAGDIVILMGDMNAEVGNDNTLLGHVLGWGNTVLITVSMTVGY